MKRILTPCQCASRLVCACILAALAWGCEDVIDVDLDRVAPKLVIEGVLSDEVVYFNVTRTTDFYEPNGVEAVSGALIVISNDDGKADTLARNPYIPGSYDWSIRTFSILPGQTYHAAVTVDGNSYTATTTMPEPIHIDSLRTEYQAGGGVGSEEDEGYRIHVFFQDVADRPDFARIKLGTYLDFYLYDGRYSDGSVIDYEYFWSVFHLNDWVGVELYTMDKTMYYYFLTLAEVWASEDGGNFLDATPANPNTNWSGGALGYFGAFNIDQKSIRVTAPDSSGKAAQRLLPVATLEASVRQ